MPRISDLSSGGDPRSADEFIVARGGASKKLNWSSIRAVLDPLYIPSGDAGLVTNGNSHDHNGGDGAQINHTALSNIGTNTHAQIDTFLASYSGTAKKAANETINNSVVGVWDDSLYFTMLPNKRYSIHGAMFVYSNAAADFIVAFHHPAGTGNVVVFKSVSFDVGSATPVHDISIGSSIGVTINGAASGIGVIRFDALLIPIVAGGTFRTGWGQVTADPSNTTVYAGSYMDYVQIN